MTAGLPERVLPIEDCDNATIVACWGVLDSGLTTVLFGWVPVTAGKLACAQCERTNGQDGNVFYWDEVILGEPHLVCDGCGEQFSQWAARDR